MQEKSHSRPEKPISFRGNFQWTDFVPIGFAPPVLRAFPTSVAFSNSRSPVRRFVGLSVCRFVDREGGCYAFRNPPDIPRRRLRKNLHIWTDPFPFADKVGGKAIFALQVEQAARADVLDAVGAVKEHVAPVQPVGSKFLRCDPRISSRSSQSPSTDASASPMARPSKGGTALPICLTICERLPANLKSSSKD